MFQAVVATVKKQNSANEQQRTSTCSAATASASNETTPASIVSVPNTMSKKMKLVMKHAPQDEQPDSRIREEIKNYLRYLPADDEDDPLVFWRRGLFPRLVETAKKHLTRSASSVPVENMFSTMRLILNGKRSTLAPHRANWLSFIHENYEQCFDIDQFDIRILAEIVSLTVNAD